MKKIVLTVLAITLVLCLTACSGAIQSVEDLLAAPQLSDDQTGVLAVLNAMSEQAIRFEYPLSGINRAPIFFMDMDSDGVSEAVAFYSISEVSVYARMAVLKKSDGEWSLVDDFEGLGTDIYSFSPLIYGDGKVYLYTVWSTTGRTVREAVIYETGTDRVRRVFSIDCTAQLLTDLNSDGTNELLFINANSAGRFTLRRVEYNEGVFVVSDSIALNKLMLDCVSLRVGRVSGSSFAIFVDENIGSSRQATEAFIANDDGLTRADFVSDDLFDLSIRSLDSYSSSVLSRDGNTYVPSQLNPTTGKMQSTFVYWYTLRAGESVYANTMYSQMFYGYGIVLPEEISNSVEVVIDSSSRIVRLLPLEGKPVSVGDDDKRVPVVELKILYLDEVYEHYLNVGYEVVGQSDRYRFCVRFPEGSEYRRYILNNFIVF